MQWNLIRLRKENRLPQRKMAKLLKISTESYGNKERGENQFKLDEMFFISRLFGLPIEKIFLPRDFGNTEISKKEEFNHETDQRSQSPIKLS